MEQPYWPYEQKFKIVQKRWFFTFYLMADKLADPGDHKNNKARLPQGWSTSFSPVSKIDNAIAKYKYDQQH